MIVIDSKHFNRGRFSKDAKIAFRNSITKLLHSLICNYSS